MPYNTLTLSANSSTYILLVITAIYILGPKIYIIALAQTPFRVSSGEGKGNITLTPLEIVRD
jgi:hypothetical protein